MTLTANMKVSDLKHSEEIKLKRIIKNDWENVLKNLPSVLNGYFLI